MSHHYSGPNFAFPRGDARLDYTDLYAFPKPGDPSKSILIMDVHPSFDVIQAGPTTAEPFAPEALYEIKIDTDGDAVADIAYQVRFASSEGGTQTATLRRLEGEEAAETGEGGQVILEGAPVSMGREAQVTQAGDYRFFAGWRSDPFFFDAGAFNNFQFTGTDFFADKDICSIALELSNAVLGPKEVRLWARTVIRADGGGWVQAERGARPSQTPFLTGEQNEAYRAAEPADDARFVDVFAHSLEHTGGFSPEEARRVARTLLPDLLRYDPTRPASYPDNGRKPSDDAADAFLTVITNGKVTGDGIGPHDDLLDEFPYLGSPHTNRSTKEDAHMKTDTSSLSRPVTELEYSPTGISDGAHGELNAAPAYGDLAHGPHGTFIKMPAGYVSPTHTHTEDYWAVVVSGVMANKKPNSPDVPLPVGSYYFQKGGEPHVTKCISPNECIFFVSQNGKFDYHE